VCDAETRDRVGGNRNAFLSELSTTRRPVIAAYSGQWLSPRSAYSGSNPDTNFSATASWSSGTRPGTMRGVDGTVAPRHLDE